jgi:hypothetical protein
MILPTVKICGTEKSYFAVVLPLLTIDFVSVSLLVRGRVLLRQVSHSLIDRLLNHDEIGPMQSWEFLLAMDTVPRVISIFKLLLLRKHAVPENPVQSEKASLISKRFSPKSLW